MASIDCSIPDEAETSEDVVFPDAVEPDTDTEGTLLPLGTVAKVLGEIGGVGKEGLLEGNFKTPPMTGGALEELEVDTVVPGGKDVDPETGCKEELDEGPVNDDLDGETSTRIGSEGEELEDPGVGVLDKVVLPDDGPVVTETDKELVVELELRDMGPTTIVGLVEEVVDREVDGPVGGTDDEDELFVDTVVGPTEGLELVELADEEVLEDEELFVETLMGPTITELELEELLEEEEVGGGVGTELLDEDDELELLVGGAVDETDVLELLLLELEVVDTALEELEDVVDPQPKIVEYEVLQKSSLSTSEQKVVVATQELLLTEVGGGVVVLPHPEMVEYENAQDWVNPLSMFPKVVHSVAVERQELLLIGGGRGSVVNLQSRLEYVLVKQVRVDPMSTLDNV